MTQSTEEPSGCPPAPTWGPHWSSALAPALPELHWREAWAWPSWMAQTALVTLLCHCDLQLVDGPCYRHHHFTLLGNCGLENWQLDLAWLPGSFLGLNERHILHIQKNVQKDITPDQMFKLLCTNPLEVSEDRWANPITVITAGKSGRPLKTGLHF